MNIYISTKVNGTPEVILSKFDRALFEALVPPGMKIHLLRFDGSVKGDEVHIEMLPLGIPRLKQEWHSLITENVNGENESWFVDEGTKLPWFLSKWKHRHLVRKISPDTSEIIDDITYKSPFFLLSWLLYPVMFLQFYYRKPVYRKYFR